MPIRFHLDEHVSPIVAETLRQHGFDVTTSQEVGLLGKDDDEQLAFAESQGRALVTCDDGFLDNGIVQSAQFGICYCPRRKYSISRLAEAVRIVAECMTKEEMRCRVEYL